MDSVADEKAPTSPHTADVEKPPSHVGVVSDEVDQLAVLGYKPELQRNRSMFHLLFQTLSIAAIPYGEGGPLISAIYGGGPLSIFVGWIVVLVLDECVALSLSELASRYPTSAGVSFCMRGGPTCADLALAILLDISAGASEYEDCSFLHQRMDLVDRQLDHYAVCQFWICVPHRSYRFNVPRGFRRDGLAAPANILRHMHHYIFHLRFR